MKNFATFCVTVLVLWLVVAMVTSSSESQPQAKSVVVLQPTSPGTAQTGHANISGTLRAGAVQLPAGAGAGKILTSDASGLGTWQAHIDNSYTAGVGLQLVGNTFSISPLGVVNSMVNDVGWGKITGEPTSFPPNGAAGGDLVGTYPNPSLATLPGSLTKVSGGGMTALASGNIGIGTATPSHRLHVTGGPIFSNWTHASDLTPSVYVTNFNSLTVGPSMGTIGVWSGVSSDGSEQKRAVSGTVTGGGTGSKYALYGFATNSGTNYGVFGNATNGTTNYGVYGSASGGTTNWAGYFDGNGYFAGDFGVGILDPAGKFHVEGGRAISSYQSGSNTFVPYGGFLAIQGLAASDTVAIKEGVRGEARGNDGRKYGVFGRASGGPTNTQTCYGGYFESETDPAGDQGVRYGVFAQGINDAVAAHNVYGIYGTATGTSVTYGVYGSGTGSPGYAGYFSGNLFANTASASIKAFLIDHPLDPENRYLSHSCVESNEYKNLYDGIARTDANGVARVSLPDWFFALNENFRYQLTIIDEDGSTDFVQAKIGQKLKNGSFVIRTSKPSVEVCWQVTGTRKDAMAKAHPIQVERAKEQPNQGTYLNPLEHGKPRSMAADYNEEAEVGNRTLPRR